MAESPAGHTPVLVEEVLELLRPAPGDTVVDATVGLGGHAARLGEAIGSTGRLIGIDVDPANLQRAGETLMDCPARVQLVRANFGDLALILRELDVPGVDVLLADLGVSSAQLDDPERGLTFQEDGPLDMRLDPELRETAADLVNTLKERELGDLLYHNSQEQGSRAIARRIIAVRREHRISTTQQLVDVIARALRVNPQSRRSKIHPATRAFQALRIAVNDEMGALDRLLEAVPGALNVGGRAGVISFHSLEDRRVKTAFRAHSQAGLLDICTKKPVTASDDEQRANPRSRSAKFRVATRPANR